MSNETLEKLIEDPKVLYIYEIGLQIYGLFEGIEDRDFLVIVDNDYDIEEKEISDNGCNFSFLKAEDWFALVLNNSIIAWICACLPKKYIIKEHVKLLLQTNPLLLRKEFDTNKRKVISELEDLFESGNTLTAQKKLFELLRDVVFANQIIENHKIVNFKTLGPYYRHMVDGTVVNPDVIKNTYEVLVCDDIIRFKNHTDSILRASKIKKIMQKNEK